MDALDQIIQEATSGRMSRANVESFCAAEGLQLTDLYNRIALTVAKRFHVGTMSYEDGDPLMNAIFGMMNDDALTGHPAPYVEPAWSIYLAFDEGEYDHGGSTDPVETFTRPQIRELLEDLEQPFSQSPEVQGLT